MVYARLEHAFAAETTTEHNVARAQVDGVDRTARCSARQHRLGSATTTASALKVRVCATQVVELRVNSRRSSALRVLVQLNTVPTAPSPAPEALTYLYHVPETESALAVEAEVDCASAILASVELIAHYSARPSCRQIIPKCPAVEAIAGSARVSPDNAFVFRALVVLHATFHVHRLTAPPAAVVEGAAMHQEALFSVYARMAILERHVKSYPA